MDQGSNWNPLCQLLVWAWHWDMNSWLQLQSVFISGIFQFWSQKWVALLSDLLANGALAKHYVSFAGMYVVMKVSLKTLLTWSKMLSWLQILRSNEHSGFFFHFWDQLNLLILRRCTYRCVKNQRAVKHWTAERRTHRAGRSWPAFLLQLLRWDQVPQDPA